MGTLEPELEQGVTYIPNNRPETIATALKRVIENRAYERTATQTALQTYGSRAVSESLDKLLQQVTSRRVQTRESRMSPITK